MTRGGDNDRKSIEVRVKEERVGARVSESRRGVRVGKR